MTKLRKKPTLLSELLAIKEAQNLEIQAISEYVQTLVDTDEIIDSTEKVTEGLKAATGIVVRPHKVRKIMREVNGLRWKKIKTLS